MIAVIANTVAILVGGFLGLLFGNKIKQDYSKTIMCGLGICTMVIGITGAITTENILLVILCLVIGTILGEWLNIEKRLDSAGEWLKRRVAKNRGGRFTEGFVTASLLFCVGSMAVMGSLDAGIRGDYSTIFTKSSLDGVMSVTFAATMGVGVLFSALSIFVYQGALTLLAGLVEPLLSVEAIGEMSAVGGILLIGTGINILGLTKERIRVGNMLPALLFPAIWFAIENLF